MSRESDLLEALKFWFADHDTINLQQANAGLPSPKGTNYPPVKFVRVAPNILRLRNEGWKINTEKDAAGVAYYRLIEKPGVPGPKSTARGGKLDLRGNPEWQCSRVGCMSGVTPDMNVTQMDPRYTTGKCFTHGKVVLQRV